MAKSKTSARPKSKAAAGKFSSPQVMVSAKQSGLRPWTWAAAFIVLSAAAVLAAVLLSGRFTGSVATLRVPDGPDMHSLLVDPRNPDHLFYGNHAGLYESRNGGKGWRSIPAMQGRDAMALALDGRTMWAAGHDILFSSPDFGKTWRPVAGEFPGTDIHGFAAAPSKPGTMYAYVVGSGLFRTTDDGANWSRVPQKEEALPGDIMSLTVEADDEKSLYAVGMQSGLLRSGDGGLTWKPATPPSSTMSVTSVPGSSRVIAATQAGLFTSDDGEKWLQLSNKQAMLVAAGQGSALFAVMMDGGLLHSEDGGKNWD